MTNLINIDTHAKFATVEAMDAATNEHLSAHRNELNATDRAVLDTIRRYSSIYRAAKMKVATIAKLIDKSEITVRRSTAKLAKLKIIERIKTKRPINVGQGANIYVILPYIAQNDRAEMNALEMTEKPVVSKVKTSNSGKDPLSFNYKPNPLLHNTYQSEPSLYERFKSLLSSTIGDTTHASRLYGVYRAKSIQMLRYDIYADHGELFEALALQALNITTQATKKKNVRNLVGYYNGVFKGLIEKALFSDIFMEYSVDPDLELCAF